MAVEGGVSCEYGLIRGNVQTREDEGKDDMKGGQSEVGYIVRMRTVGRKFGRICWAHGKAAKQTLDAFCDNIVSDCWEPAG